MTHLEALARWLSMPGDERDALLETATRIVGPWTQEEPGRWKRETLFDEDDVGRVFAADDDHDEISWSIDAEGPEECGSASTIAEAMAFADRALLGKGYGLLPADDGGPG